MPELPDIVAYISALEPRILGPQQRPKHTGVQKASAQREKCRRGPSLSDRDMTACWHSSSRLVLFGKDKSAIVFRAESMRTFAASNKQMGQRWGLQFDEDQIRRLLRESSPRSEFYKLMREELKRIGRWRNLPRGKPNRRNLASRHDLWEQ